MSIRESDPLATPELPPELEDDTGDLHFVPAPCQVACPIGTDAPSYLAYIWEENFEAAFEAITATNPFSSICGRVCDAPCEPACRRADSDGAIAIRNLKRIVMERLGRDFHLPPVAVTKEQTVAIVGAGPAGLTAAQDLAEAGYEVHVYERSDRLGGMMVWGIPAFRCPPRVIAEDMDRMLSHCPGIKLHLECGLGRDVSLDELKSRHDAVLLTIGAWWGKAMGIPGEDHERVVDGVGFLRRINGGERPRLPETVLVVGGGDVAMDACRVALRLEGCKQVKVIYRRGPDEIPARRDELEGAIEEGVEFVYHTQQTAVVANGDGLALRCLGTSLGEPDEDGRRRPVPIPGSEHDIPCGMIIAAIGQTAASEELKGLGLMAGDRVGTDFDSMATADAGVFAAGDGAFGGSTIVMAMHHGHRAAYYLKAYLEGERHPVPYRTPYRTRRVAVADDPAWEVVPRQEQAFHGLGDDPVSFPEIESTYDLEVARAEAARCYRCDAETGSADYSVRNREDIFAMARTAPHDHARHAAMLAKRLAPRDDVFPPQRPATLDDLVFLPANLSRLVIDPYREACVTETTLGGAITLAHPLLAAGLDEAPDEVRGALAQGLARSGSAYVGRAPVGNGVPWLQLLVPGEGEPDPEARALIHMLGSQFQPLPASRLTEGQLLGLGVAAPALEQAVPYALEQGFDLLLLDGSAGLGAPWAELGGVPDLTVLRDAIALLRRLKAEESIELLYFGGVRSGTDAAKLIALGCRAALLGVAMGFALGGRLGPGETLVFESDYSLEDRGRGAENLIQACGSEGSMMARCTGKTDIHNLEPEDLRAITLATSEATAIPLTGTR